MLPQFRPTQHPYYPIFMLLTIDPTCTTTGSKSEDAVRFHSNIKSGQYDTIDPRTYEAEHIQCFPFTINKEGKFSKSNIVTLDLDIPRDKQGKADRALLLDNIKRSGLSAVVYATRTPGHMRLFLEGDKYFDNRDQWKAFGKAFKKEQGSLLTRGTGYQWDTACVDHYLYMSEKIAQFNGKLITSAHYSDPEIPVGQQKRQSKQYQAKGNTVLPEMVAVFDHYMHLHYKDAYIGSHWRGEQVNVGFHWENTKFGYYHKLGSQCNTSISGKWGHGNRDKMGKSLIPQAIQDFSFIQTDPVCMVYIHLKLRRQLNGRYNRTCLQLLSGIGMISKSDKDRRYYDRQNNLVTAGRRDQLMQAKKRAIIEHIETEMAPLRRSLPQRLRTIDTYLAIGIAACRNIDETPQSHRQIETAGKVLPTAGFGSCIHRNSHVDVANNVNSNSPYIRDNMPAVTQRTTPQCTTTPDQAVRAENSGGEVSGEADCPGAEVPLL